MNIRCEYKIIVLYLARDRRNIYIYVIFGFTRTLFTVIMVRRFDGFARAFRNPAHDTTDTTFRPFLTFLTCDSTFGVGLIDAHCPELHLVGSKDAVFLPNSRIDAVWVTSARARSPKSTFRNGPVTYDQTF